MVDTDYERVAAGCPADALVVRIGMQPTTVRAAQTVSLDLHRLLEVLSRVDCHVYTGEVTPDGQYREVFTGPGMERLLGGPVPAGVPVSDAWNEAVHPEDWGSYLAGHAELSGGTPVTIEYRLVGYDGVTRWVLDRLWPRDVKSGDNTVVDGVVMDATELHRQADALRQALRAAEEANRRLQQAHAEAEWRAATDELTGLPNRRHFASTLRRQLARAAHAGAAVGLLLIDVDHFKEVNDRFGHAAGDEVLVQFADRLQAAMRPGDAVGRWGGEEFIVVLPGATDQETVQRRAEQLRSAIADTAFQVGGASLQLHACVGAAVSSGGPGSMDALINAADRALYRAKGTGRNSVSVA
jgi:diguanylate cyclase (GGDEF)-like protein